MMTKAKFRKELQEYQAVIIFDSELGEQAVADEVRKVEDTIRSHQGAIVSSVVWGRRQLAYQINKKQYGIYVVIDFNADNSLVGELSRQLRINDLCLRSLVVERDQFAPPLSTRLREQAAPVQSPGERRGSRSGSGDDSDEDFEGSDDSDEDNSDDDERDERASAQR